MGKPRMIILVRHAQSEGNKDRDIHQFIPDHRVKLTANGWGQAEEAGRQLRGLLKPDDTIQFFTSPYRRTRETTEGILRTLTGDDPTPSPFARHTIKVFEEPRLREQDFGNFQPCSAEMERMWHERADYGHFFYRIPNGESAADAYDRVAGFNESLWRQFGDEDFPSVCVLVTHGLMTRVFLMKWYHWSVEYFEDLRNVNHCEFIVMKQSPTNNKYILQNELRTWSELKRRAAVANNTIGSSPGKSAPAPGNLSSSPTIPARRWGGCVNGCNHDKVHWPRRVMRKNTMDFLGSTPAPEGEQDDHPIAAQEAEHTTVDSALSKVTRKPSTKTVPFVALPDVPASPNDASDNSSTSDEDATSECEGAAIPSPRPLPRSTTHLHPGTISSRPGLEGFSDDSDYFPGMQHAHAHSHLHSSPTKPSSSANGKSKVRASSKHRQGSKDHKVQRKMSEKGWMDESGMGNGARADALGDGDEISDDARAAFAENRTASPTPLADDEDTPILQEALKGDMIVGGKAQRQKENDLELMNFIGGGIIMDDAYIEQMKRDERKGFGEIH